MVERGSCRAFLVYDSYHKRRVVATGPEVPGFQGSAGALPHLPDLKFGFRISSPGFNHTPPNPFAFSHNVPNRNRNLGHERSRSQARLVGGQSDLQCRWAAFPDSGLSTCLLISILISTQPFGYRPQQVCWVVRFGHEIYPLHKSNLGPGPFRAVPAHVDHF